MNEALEAPVAETQAPAPAEAALLTPEQDAQQKALDAQAALRRVVQSKEELCAREIAALCEKHGCELIVGHSVKVQFKQG